MIAAEVVADLRHRGVELFVSGDQLRWRASRGVMTPELQDTLARNKPELLALLNSPREGRRLDLADCIALIRETFEAVADEYVDGALTLLDTDLDLCRRFHDTEAANDAVVNAGPTEGELQAALAAHVAVIREACERRQAQREAAADAMPELPDDATLAIGVSYGDGQPGTWDVVRRAR